MESCLNDTCMHVEALLRWLKYKKIISFIFALLIVETRLTDIPVFICAISKAEFVRNKCFKGKKEHVFFVLVY